MRVSDDFRIRSNIKLYELFNDIDVVQRIIYPTAALARPCLSNATARQIFDAGICESRPRGQLFLRWKDQIKEALSSICVTNWAKARKTQRRPEGCIQAIRYLLIGLSMAN